MGILPQGLKTRYTKENDLNLKNRLCKNKSMFHSQKKVHRSGI